MSCMVFIARRRLDDLAGAVYETVFYDAMDAILDEGLWRSYVHDVTGKTLTFESMDEFLTSDDGLGIQDLGLFQECIKAVGAAGGRIGPMAKALLKRLADEEMTLIKVNAETALSLPGPEGFAKEGDNQHTVGCDNITARSQGDGGTSAAYLAARLKKAGRDDLLEEVKTGAIKSVRAAAIKAGIVKDVPMVRMTDPTKAAESIVQRVGVEFATQLAIQLADLTKQASTPL
jgi:hypothetical protein